LATNFNKKKDGARPVLYPIDFPDLWLASPSRLAPVPSATRDAYPLTQELLALHLVEPTRQPELALGDEATNLRSHVSVESAELPGDVLGWATSNALRFDIDAAGPGWFIDTTPGNHGEFARATDAHELTAFVGSPTRDRADLLSVIMRELGHARGSDHDQKGFMNDTLPLGTRRLPRDTVGQLLHDSDEFDHLLQQEYLDPSLLDDVFASLGSW
jgi:hypothetical protein